MTGNTIGTITGGAGIAIEINWKKCYRTRMGIIKSSQNMMKRKKSGYLMLTNYKSSI